ncbi:hypothetical protein KKC13_09375 [bacterium]|nr:hypothetical protein [bacterium]MBU1957830.1 hypothetical protein [bacterium]
MKFRKLSQVLAGLLLTVSVSQADLTANFNGIKGNANEASKAFISKIDSVGFQAAGNDNIQVHYFNRYKEKNLDLLSFFTVTNLDVMRELLIKNPDFGAYAPYNMLFFKTLDQKEDTTWYGHLDSKLMLDIIGEKDEATRKTFTDMVGSLDELAKKEMKPTESKTLEHTDKLPEFPLTKMVKKLGEVEDMEEFVESFVEKHDSAFVKHEFIIAGFLDFKFEYEDAEKDFSKYDAYWVSSLCHFKFSNSVFNHGEPQAGLFAPCSVYFYIPKGSNELHVGYASVENWLATTGIKDEKMKKDMLAIDAEVVEVFKELGFELEDQSAGKKDAAPAKEEAPAKKAA